MKKLVSALLVLVMAAALTASFGCSGGSDKPANTEEAVDFNVTPLGAYNAAFAVSGFGNMTAVPKSDYSDIYGIDASKVADSVWYVSENPSLNADEVAVFKLSDASYAETLKGIFEARIARQLSVAQSYSPEEAGKLENASVTVLGSWVYYCVGASSDAMNSAINGLFK